MKAHELAVAAQPRPRRLGRGIGSGRGKTAGRGTKGQGARAGGGVRPGFEGGQNPLSMRLPKKRGFQPLERTIYQIANLRQLADLKPGRYDAAALVEAGLVKHRQLPVKILGDGEIKSKLVLIVQAASHNAQAKVAAAGGKVELVPASKGKAETK